MICVNSFKDNLKLGIYSSVIGFLYGFIVYPIVYFIVEGIIELDWFLILACGVYTGVTVMLVMHIHNKIQLKKCLQLKMEISQKRNIICYGPARKSLSGYHIGNLFLSEDALEWYPNKTNSKSKSFYILLDDIKNVEIRKTKLILYLKNTEIYFYVQKRNLWKEAILKIL